MSFYLFQLQSEKICSCWFWTFSLTHQNKMYCHTNKTRNSYCQFLLSHCYVNYNPVNRRVHSSIYLHLLCMISFQTDSVSLSEREHTMHTTTPALCLCLSLCLSLSLCCLCVQWIEVGETLTAGVERERETEGGGWSLQRRASDRDGSIYRWRDEEIERQWGERRERGRDTKRERGGRIQTQ